MPRNWPAKPCRPEKEPSNRRIIDRHAGKAQLGDLDYLLQSADDRAGALGFGLVQEPPVPRRDFNQALALEKLQAIADAVIADEELPPDEANAQIQDLLLLGTSMGGARPKKVIEHDGALWLAKFNRQDDKWNNARVEQAMLLLARDCGLNVADSTIVQVGDRDALLVRRFDRGKLDNGYARAHGQRADLAARRGHASFAGTLVLCAAGRGAAPRLVTTCERRPRATIRGTTPSLPRVMTGISRLPTT